MSASQGDHRLYILKVRNKVCLKIQADSGYVAEKRVGILGDGGRIPAVLEDEMHLIRNSKEESLETCAHSTP